MSGLCIGRPSASQSDAAVLHDTKQCPCAVKKLVRSVQEAHTTNKRQTTSKVVAFSAEMSQEREINDDITVVFSKSLLNEGDLYYSPYGQFVCVDDAIYVFLWSTINMKGTKARNTLVLQKTGQDIKYGPRASAHSSKTSGVATMLTVTNCRTYPPTAISVRTAEEASYAGHYTTFSGFRLASSASKAIAFTAELSHNVKVFPDQRIVFDKVLQNYGHAYNPMHGYFRCPDAGTYAFFMSTQTPYDAKSQWTQTTLMMDGSAVMYGPETYRAINSAHSGSASIVATLKCEKGHDVYVNTNHTYKWEYNIYGEILSTFSGFKLFNEFSGAAVAFTAVLSQDHVYMPVDSTLIFDKVITNVGESYVPLVGFFVCPDNDVYLFSWSGVSNIGGGNLDLYVDDTPVKANVFSVQSSSVSYGDSGTSTMAVILKCSPMNRVHVVSTVERTLKNTVYLAGLTSFSGFKIPSDYYD